VGWTGLERSFLIGIEAYPTSLCEWQTIKGWLEASNRRGEGDLLGPHDALWIVRQFSGSPPVARAVGACTAALTADGRSILVGDLGGTGRAWIAPLLDKLMAWARDEGAIEVRALCRPGWQRILPALGCERDGDYFVRKLP
jgi:hypothetical protein